MTRTAEGKTFDLLQLTSGAESRIIQLTNGDRWTPPTRASTSSSTSACPTAGRRTVGSHPVQGEGRLGTSTARSHASVQWQQHRQAISGDRTRTTSPTPTGCSSGTGRSCSRSQLVYELGWEMTLAGNYMYQSGKPWGREVRFNGLVPGATRVLYEPFNDDRRVAALNGLDVRLEKALRFGGTARRRGVRRLPERVQQRCLREHHRPAAGLHEFRGALPVRAAAPADARCEVPLLRLVGLGLAALDFDTARVSRCGPRSRAFVRTALARRSRAAGLAGGDASSSASRDIAGLGARRRWPHRGLRRRRRGRPVAASANASVSRMRGSRPPVASLARTASSNARTGSRSEAGSTVTSSRARLLARPTSVGCRSTARVSSGTASAPRPVATHV